MGMREKAPRCLLVLGDWSNVFAGISLTISFSILCAALTFNALTLAPDSAAHTWFQATMTLEGALWALGGACLASVNVFENNASLVAVQTIICFGGIFFMISGWGDGVPGHIISLAYVVPITDTARARLQDVSPIWGITCFMVATSIGLRGVWGLPKNKIISPFWGVAFFWLGAWTIGVFSLWGPCIVDGFITYDSLEDKQEFTLPPFTWTWIHVAQVLGAVFLTMGAIVFGVMDGIFGGRPGVAAKEMSDDDEEDNTSEDSES